MSIEALAEPTDMGSGQDGLTRELEKRTPENRDSVGSRGKIRDLKTSAAELLACSPHLGGSPWGTDLQREFTRLRQNSSCLIALLVQSSGRT